MYNALKNIMEAFHKEYNAEFFPFSLKYHICITTAKI